MQQGDVSLWDSYVYNHPLSNVYHLTGWKNVIENTYGHKAHYLVAFTDNCRNGNLIPNIRTKRIVGVLPLIHMRHFLFGNSLISIPFFDLGGILADNQEIEKELLLEAARLAQKMKVGNVELRHMQPLSCLDDIKTMSSVRITTRSDKVLMLLELPDSSEKLMKSFRSKLRSQIRRPIKEGLYSKIGRHELLDDFYEVFSINMQDLGSPVHSKRLMEHVLDEYPENARIIVVYKDKQPLACSLIIGFRKTLENPWASFLRKSSRFSPNMLLYWRMLEYGCNNGYRCFNFGRSSPGGGTYKFKEQWRARATPLHWHVILTRDKFLETEDSEKSKFEWAIEYWKKLPVPVSRILGPMIRKYIGL